MSACECVRAGERTREVLNLRKNRLVLRIVFWNADCVTVSSAQSRVKGSPLANRCPPPWSKVSLAPAPGCSVIRRQIASPPAS